eukprot:m.182466 g.182466  ORF g.182466 m.182466 type:complete len:529 (-) comp13591_c0_seq3:232-1818(-)
MIMGVKQTALVLLFVVFSHVTVAVNGQCVDNNAAIAGAGYGSCSAIVALCNDANYGTIIQTNCPVTCGVCTPTTTSTETVPTTTTKDGTTSATTTSSTTTTSTTMTTTSTTTTTTMTSTTTTTTSTTTQDGTLPPCGDNEERAVEMGFTSCTDAFQSCSEIVDGTLVLSVCSKTCGICTSSSVCRDDNKAIQALGFPDCETVKVACKHETYGYLITSSCPVTCRVCDEGEYMTTTASQGNGCEDDDIGIKAYGLPECEYLSDFCEDDTHGSAVQQYCPQTCGLCGVHTTSNPAPESTSTYNPGNACKDFDYLLAAYGLESCENEGYAYCDDPLIGASMREICQRTCRNCNPFTTLAPQTTKSFDPNCHDEDHIATTFGLGSCESVRAFCQHPLYTPILSQTCPYSCNLCAHSQTGTTLATSTVSSLKCQDNPQKLSSIGLAKCIDAAYLCHSPMYSDLVQDACPFTCGLCFTTTTTTTTTTTSTTSTTTTSTTSTTHNISTTSTTKPGVEDIPMAPSSYDVFDPLPCA